MVAGRASDEKNFQTEQLIPESEKQQYTIGTTVFPPQDEPLLAFANRAGRYIYCNGRIS